MLCLALFLPLAFYFGLVARKPVPIAAVEAKVVPSVWSRDDLWSEFAVRTTFYEENGKQSMHLVPLKPLARPDVLAYWSPSREANVLSDQAILLGPLGESHSLALPKEALAKNGNLVLYSLADQKILGQSKPVEFKR